MAVIKGEVQQSICEQEQRIRDLINEPRKRHTLIKKLGLWHQLCSCLDVIGDTELAIGAYTAQALGANKGVQKLEARLSQMTRGSWRQVRSRARTQHHEQVDRFRFQHHRQAFLARLEAQWLAAC